MKVVILLMTFGLLGFVVGAPKPQKDAIIQSSHNENEGTGTYRWGYLSSDGSKQDQSGTLKNNPDPKGLPFQTVQGSFSYRDTKGRIVTTVYTADERGYRPKTTIQ